MKKIKDLFSGSAMPAAYKVYQDMTLEDFIKIYNKMVSHSSLLNDLYKKCLEAIIEPATDTHNRVSALECVPVEALTTLFLENKRIAPKVISCFKDLQCKNLADISEIKPNSIFGQLGAKNKGSVQAIAVIQYLHQHTNDVLKHWDSQKPVMLPEHYSAELDVISQLCDLLPSLIDYVSESKKMTGGVLRMFCLENKTVEEIRADKNMKSTENVLIHIRMFASGLIDGSVLTGRYSFDPSFLLKLREKISQLLYQGEELIHCPENMKRSVLMSILGMTLGNVKDENYRLRSSIVLRDLSVSNLHRLASLFTSVLKNNAYYPASKEELWEIFDAETEKYAVENKKGLFESLLKYHTGVESSNETYWLNGRLLAKYQRIARIVYDNAPDSVKKEDVIAIYNNLYPDEKIEKISAGDIKEITGISLVGKLGYLIYGRKFIPFRQAFREKLQALDDIVSFDSLKNELNKDGYKVQDETLKSYLSNSHYVYDLDNKDLYCSQDKTDDYQNHRWAKSRNYGIQNKLVNLIKNKIERTSLSSIDFENSKRIIKTWCEENGVIFYNTFSALCNKYIDINPEEGAKTKPFFVSNQRLKINKEVSEKIDWSAIGLSGKYRSFEVYAYGLTFELLRKSTDKRLRISDLASKLYEWAKENLPELDISDKAIRKFFDKEKLPNELSREVRPNGEVFIFENTDLQTLPADDSQPENNLQYVADNRQDQSDQLIDSPKLVVADVSDRVQVSYTETFDWHKIREVLPRELNYYTRFYSTLLDNDTLDKFQHFIENSTNYYLKETIPQDLYEYWYARTNYSLNRRYMSDLARCFESLLKDIYYRVKDKDPMTKSLAEICNLGFMEFYPACTSSRNAQSPFERIFADLHFKRNKEAHGVYLEMSSANIAKCILDYTALYIYTVSKYVM